MPWNEFCQLLEKIPQDVAAAQVPVKSLGISLQDLLNGCPLLSDQGPCLYQFGYQDFTLVHNIGDGDCLYHALESRNLEPEEVTQLRFKVAAQRLLMNGDPWSNALYVAAALKQTPCTSHLVATLMAGRPALPDEVYAALQRIPKIYAGDNEIIQWCRYAKKVVLSVDARGFLSTINQYGKTVILPLPGCESQTFQQEYSNADVALFYSNGHWQRIRRVHGWLCAPGGLPPREKQTPDRVHSTF